MSSEWCLETALRPVDTASIHAYRSRRARAAHASKGSNATDVGCRPHSCDSLRTERGAVASCAWSRCVEPEQRRSSRISSCGVRYSHWSRCWAWRSPSEGTPCEWGLPWGGCSRRVEQPLMGRLEPSYGRSATRSPRESPRDFRMAGRLVSLSAPVRPYRTLGRRGAKSNGWWMISTAGSTTTVVRWTGSSPWWDTTTGVLPRRSGEHPHARPAVEP